jgi:RHS repeat-associated protein
MPGAPPTTDGLTATTAFGYAGGYTDPDGLIYLINRYYDPATGQFTSVDPDVVDTSCPETRRLNMDLLPLIVPLLIIGVIVYMFTRRTRERASNAPLRGEIEARVCFSTLLARVSMLGTGGFEGGTRGYWNTLKGPARLIVGTDAFMVSSFFWEYAFRGRESSIALSQEPSSAVARDSIIITGESGGRQVQLAISRRGALPRPRQVRVRCWFVSGARV